MMQAGAAAHAGWLHTPLVMAGPLAAAADEVDAAWVGLPGGVRPVVGRWASWSRLQHHRWQQQQLLTLDNTSGSLGKRCA